MKKMIYNGKIVDGETFHPPYAPKGMTLVECRKIDKKMRDNDVEFAKKMIKQLSE